MNQRVSGQHSSEIPDKAIALQRWAHNPKEEDSVTLAEVRKNSGLDIAAGENACTVHQFRQMMTAGAVSYGGGIGNCSWLACPVMRYLSKKQERPARC